MSVDMLHDYGIHIPSRTIFLRRDDYVDDGTSDPGVDHKMATQFIKNLIILEAISSDPIHIILSTVGGDVIEGMAIYDAIKRSPCHVSIAVYGQASSMGSYLLQSADKRLMAPHSILMVHMGSESHSGHPRIVRNWVKFEEEFGKVMDDILRTKILEKRPEFRGKKFEEMMNFDTIFTAQQAVDMGLADEVIGG